jgi:tetratricopeptide (TPR) repeat protein
MLVARQLAPRFRNQARLEYRLAMEQDQTLTEPATREGSRLVDGVADAMQLVPDRNYAPRVINDLVTLIRARLPATAATLDRTLAEREPNDTHLLERALQQVEVDLAAGAAAPWCADDVTACATRGIAIADRYVQLAPRLCAPHTYLARLVAAAGDPRGAIDGLTEAANAVEDRSECLKALARLAAAHGDPQAVDLALERLSHTCTTDNECVENSVFVAQVNEGRGNYRLALLYYRRAAERAPRRADLAERVASLGSRRGMAESVGSEPRAGRVPSAGWATLDGGSAARPFGGSRTH